MKITGLILLTAFGLSVSAYGSERQISGRSVSALGADNGKATAVSQATADKQTSTASSRPSSQLLPLQLSAPPTAQAGLPLEGVSVTLQNPGSAMPNARLRLIIHSDRSAGVQRELNPANVKVEVLEGGRWIPVDLGMVDNNVMGAIGAEGVNAHRERYGRGGFGIAAGMNKTWQLRVTFNLPGTYSLIAAVSPDNGSRHLAQPAQSIIVVY